jgi:hypothetical protein
LANETKSSLKKTKTWLSGIDAYTLHKPYRLHFRRRRTYAKGVDDLWQADLVDMTSLARYNDGKRYILTIIDVFSKMAWCVILKNKSGSTITEAFSLVLGGLRRCTFLQTDKGTEFLNLSFRKLLADNDIKFYTSENEEIKASVVERFNRTLKTRMYRFFTWSSSFRYVDVLQDIVDSYNRSYHSSIKMAPIDVTKANERVVRVKLYPTKKPQPKKYPFTVGDNVRLRQSRRAFQKGYLASWTEELFSVKRVIPMDPPMYAISDLSGEPIKGGFNAQELQKVIKTNDDDIFKVEKIIRTRTKDGKKQFYVKWLGYPDKFNSWTDYIIT